MHGSGRARRGARLCFARLALAGLTGFGLPERSETALCSSRLSWLTGKLKPCNLDSAPLHLGSGWALYFTPKAVRFVQAQSVCFCGKVHGFSFRKNVQIMY